MIDGILESILFPVPEIQITYYNGYTCIHQIFIHNIWFRIYIQYLDVNTIPFTVDELSLRFFRLS